MVQRSVPRGRQLDQPRGELEDMERIIASPLLVTTVAERPDLGRRPQRRRGCRRA
jgi:hypothetical protein